jgi:hypothetical protein
MASHQDNEQTRFVRINHQNAGSDFDEFKYHTLNGTHTVEESGKQTWVHIHDYGNPRRAGTRAEMSIITTEDGNKFLEMTMTPIDNAPISRSYHTKIVIDKPDGWAEFVEKTLQGYYPDDDIKQAITNALNTTYEVC